MIDALSLLLGLVTGGLQTAALSTDPHAVEVVNPVQEFGEVPAGLTVQRRVTVRNSTNREIKVSRSQSGCACTTLTEVSIGPGATEEVAIRLETAGLEGPLQRSVPLRIEPLGQILAVELRGRVLPGLRVVPPALAFDLSTATGRRKVLELHWVRPLRLIAINTDSPAVGLQTDDESGKTLRIHVELDDSTVARDTALDINLVIDAGGHRLEIPVPVAIRKLRP